jgi:hypothetical protein
VTQESPEYRIHMILGQRVQKHRHVSLLNLINSQVMTGREWKRICSSINTFEITNGSVWQQDETEYDEDTEVEKFLIKWKVRFVEVYCGQITPAR